MKKIMVVCFSLLLSVAAHAQTAMPESINKLLEVSQAEKAIGSAYGEINQMIDGMAAQLGVTDAEKPMFEAYAKKVEGILKAEMGWDKLKAPITEVYAKVFTEAEIKGLIEFYQSTAGKAYAEKMPLITTETMKLTQELVMGAMPKIQEAAIEFATEVQKARTK